MKQLTALLLLLALAGCKQDLVADLPDAGADCVPGPHILYLNREPTTFYPGDGYDPVTNTVSFLDQERTTLGPSLTQTVWQDMVDCVAGHLAPFAIQITTVDPGPVDHIEIAASQDSVELGLEPDISAVALPGACGDSPGRALGFVFLGPWAPVDDRMMCLGTTWALALIAGLGPVSGCTDIMGWDWCGYDRSLLDEELPCVDEMGNPGDCRCGGTTQSSHAGLLDAFGASVCVP